MTAGAGLPELVRPAGKLSPGRRAGEEALDAKGGGKPLGQVWGALTVNGAMDRSGPTSRCLGVHVDPEVAPGFWSPVDVKAVDWSYTLEGTPQ